MPILRIKSGTNAGLTFNLVDESVVIGRESPNGLTINDIGASRKHAEIFRIGEMYFIKDLESRNGTFVNDEVVTEEILQTGDKIRIGQTIFTVDDSPAELEKKRKTEEEIEEVEFNNLDHEEDYAQTIVLDIDTLKQAQQQSPDGKELRNLSIISDITKSIAAEKSQQKMLSKILAVIGKGINTDSGYIFVKDPKSNKFLANAVWHSNVEDNKKSVAVSTSIVKRVLEVGKPILTTDASSDTRFASKESVVIRKIRSVIAAPLKSRNIIHGVMYFNMNRASESFSAEDLELVTTVALITGTAVDSITAIIKQQETMFSTIYSLVSLLDEREKKMKGHSKRVMNYCAAIGKEMELTRQQRYWVEMAALLHDLGKLGVPEDEEDRLKRMEAAVKTCENLITNMKDLDAVIPAIKYQYAKFDGSGYPHDVTKAEIPLSARILAVAKDFDVMTTIGGISQEGMNVKEALLDIGRNAVKRYDKNVVQALLKSYKNGSLFSPVPIVKNVIGEENK